MEQQGYRNPNQNYSSSYNQYEGLYDQCGNDKIYFAAAYMRFSRDDGQTYDSSSIQTQTMMLEKFCEEHGFRIYGFYKDDGYTGLNFDRPDFQRMLRDIESGKVNLVVTKDLSRLGRDYIQTGNYIENYFVDKNIRYIAINDGVDTLKQDTDFVPFKNIFNNLYSRDISRKIKSAKHQRALRGMFITSYPPYGYKKNPEDKSRLIIDEKRERS